MYKRKRYFKSRAIVVNKSGLLFSCVFVFVFFTAYFAAKINLLAGGFYAEAVGKAVPAFKCDELKKTKKNNFFSDYNVISSVLPVVCANDSMKKKYDALFSGDIKVKKENDTPQKKSEENEKPLVREVNSAGGASFNNATEYAVNFNELLSEGFFMDTSKNEYKVLVISTHSSEGYAATGGRSENESENVLRVGEALAKTLNNGGIKTIHDKTKNDYPSYNGSYKKALGVIEENLKKYPEIEIVIDVHRDYMENKEGVKLKPTAKLSGNKKAAQIMFVIGTDAMELYHPNWRENLRLAVKLQNILNGDSPSLCRSINIRTERFNQHMTRGSMIIEVGSSENTIEEAVYSAELLGRAIVKAFK